MDMPTELAIAIVTTTGTLIVSIVNGFMTRNNAKKQEKAAQEVKEYRTKRERLDKAKWKVLIATMGGVSLLLHQAHGDKLNGNVEAALEEINDAKSELDDVQSDILATT